MKDKPDENPTREPSPREEDRPDATRDDDPQHWMPGDRGWTC